VNDFKLMEKIGEGGFSKVKKVMRLIVEEDGTEIIDYFAMKVLPFY